MLAFLGLGAVTAGGILIATFRKTAPKELPEYQYEAPEIEIETFNKEGLVPDLDAIEAALYIGNTVKALTLIIMSLSQRGIVTLLNNRPLQLELTNPTDGLEDYEQALVDGIADDGTLPQATIDRVMKLVSARFAAQGVECRSGGDTPRVHPPGRFGLGYVPPAAAPGAPRPRGQLPALDHPVAELPAGAGQRRSARRDAGRRVDARFAGLPHGASRRSSGQHHGGRGGQGGRRRGGTGGPGDSLRGGRLWRGADWLRRLPLGLPQRVPFSVRARCVPFGLCALELSQRLSFGLPLPLGLPQRLSQRVREQLLVGVIRREKDSLYEIGAKSESHLV